MDYPIAAVRIPEEFDEIHGRFTPSIHYDQRAFFLLLLNS
jgi:hypothetical protein